MFTLKKILLPVDFSERSAAVAPYAKAFALPFQSHVVLFHAEDSRRAARAEHMNVIKTQLESLACNQFNDVLVTREVAEGDPAAKIVDYAHAEGVDLIMMPTRGCGPYRRFLLGSVTAKVLHDSDCPVWTSVHSEAAVPPDSVSYRKIACAVDLGPNTDQVLSWASGLCSACKGRLLVIHITKSVEPILAEASEPHLQLELVRTATEEIADRLKRMKIEAEIAVGSGSVADETYKHAAQFAADLLVIGRHAAKGFTGRLRPHSYSIIRESLCPVVSI